MLIKCIVLTNQMIRKCQIVYRCVLLWEKYFTCTVRNNCCFQCGEKWWKLFVRAPDVYKKQGKKRDSSLTFTHIQYTEHLRNDQKGAPQYSEQKYNSWRGHWKRRGDNDNTVIGWSERCVSWSCKGGGEEVGGVQHHTCLCWTTTRWEAQMGEGVWDQWGEEGEQPFVR